MVGGACSRYTTLLPIDLNGYIFKLALIQCQEHTIDLPQLLKAPTAGHGPASSFKGYKKIVLYVFEQAYLIGGEI